MRIKKAGVVCTTLLALLCLLSFQAAAGHAPYQGYIYDSWNETAASPNGYEATWVLNGEQMGAGRLDSPSDLFRQGEYTYIADTGNNRIVVLDAAFRCVRILDTFIDQQGNSTTLNRPQGVFATAEGLLLIADTDNKRVILCREDGSNASFLKKPEEGIYPDNIEFLPLRVIRDSVGNINPLFI